MFYKADVLVSGKINNQFHTINALRIWGCTEQNDFAWILHAQKKLLRAYYRLYAIIRQYGEEEIEENEIENTWEVYN
jgi:hypothetical protein